MTTIQVQLGPRTYPIYVGAGILGRAAELILQNIRPTRVAVLTHPALEQRYAAPVARQLAEAGVPASVILVPAGERHKNLRTVERLYAELVAAGMDRRSLLVTVGGGVLGDVGGFVAATYMRGIPVVQVPTTLLAQVDASVGGKTGVDLPGGKNLVGAFHQPRAVLIDVTTLSTLPSRELRSGLAEIVKYGIISDDRFFDRTTADATRLLARDEGALERAILRSCEIKAAVVSGDETEQGRRAILNFGHTVGHALESVTRYRRLKHGEAVAIGMVAAARVGEELGVTPRAVTDRIGTALEAVRLPTTCPADVPVDSILDAMSRDKKSVGGRLRFVLARAIGDVFVEEDVRSPAVRAAICRPCGHLERA